MQCGCIYCPRGPTGEKFDAFSAACYDAAARNVGIIIIMPKCASCRTKVCRCAVRDDADFVVIDDDDGYVEVDTESAGRRRSRKTRDVPPLSASHPQVQQSRRDRWSRAWKNVSWAFEWATEEEGAPDALLTQSTDALVVLEEEIARTSRDGDDHGDYDDAKDVAELSSGRLSAGGVTVGCLE